MPSASEITNPSFHIERKKRDYWLGIVARFMVRVKEAEIENVEGLAPRLSHQCHCAHETHLPPKQLEMHCEDGTGK
jgi:hypothetical protein